MSIDSWRRKRRVNNVLMAATAAQNLAGGLENGDSKTITDSVRNYARYASRAMNPATLSDALKNNFTEDFFDSIKKENGKLADSMKNAKELSRALAKMIRAISAAFGRVMGLGSENGLSDTPDDHNGPASLGPGMDM